MERRDFLRTILGTATLLASAGQTRAAKSVQISQVRNELMKKNTASFKNWPEVFDAPGSNSFGVTEEGRPKNGVTFYQAADPSSEEMTFDISNNHIMASISRTGLFRHVCIAKGLSRAAETPDSLRGVRAEKELIDGAPWLFTLAMQDQPPVSLHALSGTSVDLLDNLFPVYAFHDKGWRVRLMAFAPQAAPHTAPRAVATVLLIENLGTQPLRGTVTTSLIALDNAAPEAHQAMVGWEHSAGAITDFDVAPGQSQAIALVLLLGENRDELQNTALALRAHDALWWFNTTRSWHRGRLGELSIPDAPFYAESLVRQSELCRQAALYLPDGRFGGAFLGSDYWGLKDWHSSPVWLKDTFYQMLAMSLFNPAQCADAILFFNQWAMPSEPYGRGRERFPNAPRETHSLGNSLAPFVLAGCYYRATGDKAFFTTHPELLDSARLCFAAMLKSRRYQDVFLFPSMYVSDGDARGDFHTGTNALAWFALQAMARIAREAYGNEVLSVEWNRLAQRVKTDMRRHCIGSGKRGEQFFEGANYDGTFVTDLYDGEESDAALMPFYGLAEPDDPALLRFCGMALTSENQFYNSAIDGVRWIDGDFKNAATFPAWVNALAGAENEDAQSERLKRIAQLTDLDGSIWWWPYAARAQSPSNVARRNGAAKCGWAAGTYLCQFTHTLLGLEIDVPDRHFRLRPFSAFNEFCWTNCRLGIAVFDVGYARHGSVITAHVTNQNHEAFRGPIELILPLHAKLEACRINGEQSSAFQATNRFDRASIRVERTVEPGQDFAVEIVFSTPR